MHPCTPSASRLLALTPLDTAPFAMMPAAQAAKEGDINCMALAGQMLLGGYGCTADPAEGKRWLAEAHARCAPGQDPTELASK